MQLWRRFTVEAEQDEGAVPPRVVKRIATAVGRPDAKVLKAEMDEMRAGVRKLFEAILTGAARRK